MLRIQGIRQRRKGTQGLNTQGEVEKWTQLGHIRERESSDSPEGEDWTGSGEYTQGFQNKRGTSGP